VRFVEFLLRAVFLTLGNLFTAHITDNSLMDEAAVLACAAQKAGRGRPMPKDVGLGIATTFGQERAIRPGWPVSLACASTVPPAASPWRS